MKRAFLLLLFACSVAIAFGQAPYGLTYGEDAPITFEDTGFIPYFLIDTNQTGNIWQIGRPQKNFMDSAYSTPYSLITDTLSLYPINTMSTVQMTFLATEGYMWLTFFHRYDTDSLKDGGKIELSIDGVGWHNVTDSSYWHANGFWTEWGSDFYSYQDSVASLNGPGFSGHSGGWATAQFNFYYQDAPIYPDTFQLRFVFASDSLDTGKEGWLIDNISIGTDHLGVEDHQIAESLFYPNPSDGTVRMKGLHAAMQEWRVYDCSGRAVKVSHQTGNDQLDLSDLDNGVYFISIATDKFVKTEKVILRKK
ncbi:MAG: T9SS type A sorting domain-containing protein [Flavobacteriales bacterium]|nr:T9SS type A sorting domain-containing protein [Flavobacteriales bacterium]